MENIISEKEKLDKLINYYKDKGLLIVGLNDSQGVNVTSTFFVPLSKSTAPTTPTTIIGTIISNIFFIISSFLIKIYYLIMIYFQKSSPFMVRKNIKLLI